MFRTSATQCIALSLLSCLPLAAIAQPGKSFLKEAEKHMEQFQFPQAIERYTLAIEVSPGMIKAHEGRAEAHERNAQPELGAADRKTAALLDPKDADLSARAAQAYLDLGFLDEALQLCDVAISADKKHMEAWLIHTRTCLAQGALDEAMVSADAALNIKRTTDTHFLHGQVAFARRDYNTALADFEQVIEWNYLYVSAYVGLCETLLELYKTYTASAMQTRTLERIVEQSTLALDLDPANNEARIARSKAYALKKELAQAIDDISRVVANGLEEPEVFMLRATYYEDYGQYQNAVNDLNRVIKLYPGDPEAYLMRAKCHQANLDLSKSLKDLRTAHELFAEQGRDPKEIEPAIAKVENEVFEAEREAVPPTIKLLAPTVVDGKALVAAALTELRLVGIAKDVHDVMTVSSKGVEDPGTRAAERTFELVVPIDTGAQTVSIEAVDVYGNRGSISIELARTESDLPLITMTAPKIDANGRMEFSSSDPSVILEGRINDDSRIRRITVNGVNASFDPERPDPTFGLKVDVDKQLAIEVLAEDIHGNIARRSFMVERSEPAVAATVVVPVTKKEAPEKPRGEPAPALGPMGITWLVMVENHDYRDMPGVVSSASDQQKMRDAFSSYTIHNTVRKKNMTKEGLERFFNIELRDLVRKNKVNSILVWYVGHGKFVGDRSYWIPIDGAKDQQVSFYDSSPLKAVMKAYSGTVTHTMVVSDASMNDPSFYELTR